MHLCADAERTAQLTDWRARVGLEEGLRRTIDSVNRKHFPHGG
jgi:nucleoside-diphosphate-sugar epimerase